ncbi:MAG: insulinase family protein [Chlorobi bacterium]|nr:insulinase family protein [Chlorobiota bacterium]MCI0717195.1 insulinase family protein [Chlorobiota bacterium]
MHNISSASLTKNSKIKFKEYELSNGLKVILSKDSSVPSVAVNLCYHVGSKDEDPDKRGYAHLFEHLMFGGSKNIQPGDYDRLAQSHGCENNAYTTEDKTCYYLLAPSHQLEFALWLESDRMLGFGIPEESLLKQKEVVIEEKKQNFDNRPYGTVSIEMASRLFKKSGYRWDTIGDIKDIEKASLADIKAFYEQHYVPNNAVLTIVGDIEFDSTFKLTEKYFGSIPQSLNGQRKKFQEVVLTAEVTENILDNIQLPGIFIAYRVPEENSREFYEFDILSDILSTGESSRFYNEIVYKKQLAAEIGCWVDAKEFAGVFYIYAILMPGVKIQTVQKEIDRIIDEVKAGKLTEKELEKIKNKVETRNTYRLQTNLSKADILSHYKTFYNNPELINTNIENYHYVTLNGIQESAIKFLNNSNRVVLNYLPAEGKSANTSK